MTAQTQLYIYNQRNTVVLLDTTGGIGATRRFDIVYAKELTIQRGVNNVLQFAFINTDEKPVNLLGQTILFRIINQNNQELLFQKAINLTLPLTGLAQIEITAAETQGFVAEQCYYSLEVVNTATGTPINGAVFTDAQGTARGVLRIMNSTYPRQVGSTEITIPSHKQPTISNSVTYYTSTYYTNGQTVTTFQCTYSNFIGNIQFEGCNVADFVNNYTINEVKNNGVDANLFVYGNSLNNQYYSGTEGYTIMGYHPYIRIQINNQGSNTVPNLGSNQKEATNNQNNLWGDMVVAYAR